eukprot:scaffold1508_cov178-Amphora_coffeaeformis.AAC.7
MMSRQNGPNQHGQDVCADTREREKTQKAIPFVPTTNNHMNNDSKRTPIRKDSMRWSDEDLRSRLGRGFGDTSHILLHHNGASFAYQQAIGKVFQNHVRQPRRERFLVKGLRQYHEGCQDNGKRLKGSSDVAQDKVPHQGRDDGNGKDARWSHATQKDHATKFLPPCHGFDA